MENDDYNDPECIAFLDVLQLGNYLWYCVLCIYGKIGMTSPAGCIHKHLQIINNKPQSGPVTKGEQDTHFILTLQSLT
eukprot:1145433-Pelagomonas_calceolata.AAC.1